MKYRTDVANLPATQKTYVHEWGVGKVRDGSLYAAHIHNTIRRNQWVDLECEAGKRYSVINKLLHQSILESGCGYMANCSIDRRQNNMTLKKVHSKSIECSPPDLVFIARHSIKENEELLYFYNNEEMRKLKRMS